MVIGEIMENQNYLMIQNNVVINVCVWDGDTEQWQPPSDVLMLVQATTPTKIWELVGEEYVLVDSVGNADIGFTWDGTFAITNQPKPELPIQPETTGTQTL
jgi:hypothetical protein